MRFIPVGRVVSPHGLRGEVKFRYYNETGTTLPEYPSFFVDEGGAKTELKLSTARRQGNAFLMKFAGLETPEGVRFLLKKELLVAEDDLPALGEDEYYDYQLIGLRVLTEKERMVGTVKDIIHTGANDILVIDGPPEVLVPMTEGHIVSVDRSNGLVRVREEAVVE